MSLILPFEKINENVSYNEVPTYLFDDKNNDKNLFEIDIKNDCKIILVNINNDFRVHARVSSAKNVTFSFFSINKISSVEMEFDLLENSNLIAYFADFISSDCKMNVKVNLNGSNSSCVWNLASLSKNEEHKYADVSVIHNSPNTFCKINNFGVSKDHSKLVFSGICHIKNGSHNSKAHQNAKIMVFDDCCDSVAKPVLKIDDNSIEASHAAVVGKISDDQLFYLTSRGLSVEQARELITFGYLKPILLGFEDDKIKEMITKRIEGEF